MKKAIHSILTKILAAAIALTAVCCAAACGGEKPSEENVEISISKTEIELFEGESVRLTVTVSPADAKDKNIEWRSSDAAVATVDDGVVTGKKAGETTITARTNEKTVSCKVKVKAKEDSGSSSSSPESDSDSGNSSDSGSSDGGSASDNASGSDSENSSENNSES